MNRTSFWTKFIFPIKKEEIKPFFLLASLMFFIIFNNTMVRNLKDCFLVMNTGGFSIAFIKLWGVLPATFLALILFAKVSNMMKQENVFYFFISIFLLFFAFFGFVVFPYQDSISLHGPAEWLRAHLPDSFDKFIGLIEYWDYSLFYIISELWSSIVVSLLFWQFANAVVMKEDAKRFYPLFGVIADAGMIIAGGFLVYITSEKGDDFNTVACWQDKMQVLTGLIIFSGLCSALIYYLGNRYFQRIEHEALQTQQRTDLSLIESARFLRGSPNMRYLALMVLGFAVTSNMIEIAWKCQIEEVCDSMAEFTNMMGYFSIITGMTTIFLVFIGGGILRTRGWLFGALVAPLFMLVVGIGFFGLLFVKNEFSISTIFAYSLMTVVTLIGSLENILGKSIKFSMFDPTKEMTFIPMDLESKLKGKAAIDMFGVRLGKSAGSLFHQGVAVLFESFQASIFLYLLTFTTIIGVWIFAIKKLYERYIKYHAF